MKSMKPKKVSSAEEMRKNLKVIESIAKKDTAQAEISGKLAEMVQKQRQFQKTWLTRLFVQTEIEEMEKQMKEGATISIQWYGIPFPRKLLSIEHDIKFFEYQEIVGKENYLRQALKNDGLTDADLGDVLSGKFKKHQDMLKDSKEKENKQEEVRK